MNQYDIPITFHADELTADWQLARRRQPLRRIPPL